MAKKSTRNTRGRIVSAAWKLFYEQGYEDTTVEEIIELSDRVMTVCQGRINGEFIGDEINQDDLMAAAFGITRKSEGKA